MATISIRCTCGRSLDRVPRMKSATIQVQRTCRGCGKCWLLLLKPLASDSLMTITEVTLSEKETTR